MGLPTVIDETTIATIRRDMTVGKRIVFVSGNFNVVHPGHLRLLKFAYENGDALIVGLFPDETRGVTVPAMLRLEGLRSISFVANAFLMNQPVEQVIAELRPDVVVKGKEFADRFNPERQVVDSYGGKLLFSSGEVQFSSLALLQKEYFQRDFSNISKPLDFPARRGFTINGLKQVLDRFAGLRVLVIGDLIIDTYIDCEPLGMSQEDPTIVVTPLEERTFVGGAGIVSLHAKGLGADVNFLTVVGKDDDASFARQQFDKYDLKAEMIVDLTRPTTNKRRFRARGRSLLRVNTLRQHSVEHAIAERMLAYVEAALPKTDLLLFSDFNYGCLPQVLVDAVVERGRALGVMMMADSQASSQVADIARFKDMTLVTPTEREARMAIGDYEAGLIVVAERLKEVSRARHVFVTLGSEGLLIHSGMNGESQADRLPAFNTSPKDVAGAGDSLFTCTSLAMCCGVDVWRSAYLGSLAAACQASRVGNTPLLTKDILAEIDFPDLPR
jgi:rfaE bifunctional protein kinase chain/domain